MKVLKTNLSATELRKTIGKWNLCTSMRFKNTAAMVSAIKQCGSFGLIPGDNCYGLSAFYSPLWVTESLTKCTSETCEETHVFAGTLPGTFPIDNNIYNISKEGSSFEEVSPDGEEPSANLSNKKNIVTTESLAAAKDFFHLINRDAAQKAQVLTPLTDCINKPDRAYTRLDMLKVRDQELCQTGSVLYVRQPCGRYDERESEEQIIAEAQGRLMAKDQNPWVELVS